MSAGPYLTVGHLERSVREAATGAVISLEKRRKGLSYDRLQETFYQRRIPIFGTAGQGMVRATVGVPFDVEFVYAPNQRDVDLDTPHTNFGVFCLGHVPVGGTTDANNPDCLVAVSPQIIGWSHDLGKDIINGAMVGISATVGVGGLDIDFSGYVDVTFQGWASPVEGVSALDVGQ